MKKIVAHIDLDSFFVSVERLLDTSLIGKPVIIGGTSDRGVVASCSYEARKLGVHSAMPIKKARYLCPNGVYLAGNKDEYCKYSEIVTNIVEEKAPVYEKASIDEFYIDLSGMDRFFGSFKWAHELRQKVIKETGLPITLGLSVNKTVAKIATGEAKPSGECFVPWGREKHFIAPMPIKRMPMLGTQTASVLNSLGIKTIGVLSEISRDALRNVLGKNGIMFWEKANGIDNSAIVASHKQKSLATERTLSKDTTDINLIRIILIGMTEKLSYQLRNKRMYTSCVSLKIRYSDFETHSSQKKIAYTAFEHHLIPVVLQLFSHNYTRRQSIRLIGVRFSSLINETFQLSLFDDDVKKIGLYKSLDNIRDSYGAKAIRIAAGK